jgi:hypothetical protein
MIFLPQFQFNDIAVYLGTATRNNGFPIKQRCLLFTIAITTTPKSRFPCDEIWLVSRLLVLSWAGFFCSLLCFLRLSSLLRSGLVSYILLYAPVSSAFVAAGTVVVLIFTSVVKVSYVCVVSENCLPSETDNSLSGSTIPAFRRWLSSGVQQWSLPACCLGHVF